MKVSRRELAGALAGSVAVFAQTPEAPRDELAVQREQARKNAEALAKAEVAMTLEPSFVFRP